MVVYLTEQQTAEFGRYVVECNHDIKQIAAKMGLTYYKARNHYYHKKYNRLKSDAQINIIENDQISIRGEKASEDRLSDSPLLSISSPSDPPSPLLSISSPYNASSPHNDSSPQDDIHQVLSEQADLPETIDKMVIDKLARPQFSDIIGLDKVKILFAHHLVFPVKIKAPASSLSNILLYGPPGAGKAHFARAAAGEAQCPLLYVNAAEITSTWNGRCGFITKELFHKSCEEVPSIVLLDDADVFFNEEISGEKNRRDKASIFSLIDALNGRGVVVIATSSYPWKLDSIFVRKFRHTIYLRLPDREELELLLQAELDSYTNSPRSFFQYSNIDTKILSSMMEEKKYNRAAVKRAIEEASEFSIERLVKEQPYARVKAAMEEDVSLFSAPFEIIQEDLVCVVESSKVSSSADVDRYTTWRKNLV